MTENLNGLKSYLIFLMPEYVLDRFCEVYPFRGLKGFTPSMIQTIQGTAEATGSVRELQVRMWSSIFKNLNYKWQDCFMTQISAYIIKGTYAAQVCNWGKSCTETSYSNIKSAELYPFHFWVVSDVENICCRLNARSSLPCSSVWSGAKFMVLVAKITFILEYF